MSTQDTTQLGVAKLLESYTPVAGVADELIGHDAQVRPVWRKFINYLGAMNSGELGARLARADVYLRDAGVFYRQYDEGTKDTRDRTFSHVPVLLSQTEWDAISTGIVERANLLEFVASDLYGENTLVRDGRLPPELVANNAKWLRPMVGARPKSGHWLQFVAFDIGRSPDGQWRVLADRTQAPSGFGFALENRIATARAFANVYQDSNVHRLAGFFREFRETLGSLRQHPDSPIGILSPGQSHDTYYEDAFIARYLGLVLLQGEDLVVKNGQLLMRTVEGLQPIDVLWRRIRSALADPLELNEYTNVGVAGLATAVREHQATLVNSIGTGALETRAMLAFLPRLQEVLHGAPFSLPNVATWWCGDADARDYVKNNLERMKISKAWVGHREMPGEIYGSLSGDSELSGSEDALVHWVDGDAADLVGQEPVTLSTTPVIESGRLVPRPMTLRVFAARSADGWRVMPGGYARIDVSGESKDHRLRYDGAVADVWVVSDTPVKRESLFSTNTGSVIPKTSTALPSRAADNLLWLGRYTERAENQVRYLRAYHYRLAESEFEETRLLDTMTTFMPKLDLDVEEDATSTLKQTLRSAILCTGRVRERMSPDAWQALNTLNDSINALPDDLSPGESSGEAMNGLLRGISGFAGLVHENMYRSIGWRFLSLGRSLERATYLCELLVTFAPPDVATSRLDLLLELGDNSMTYRSRYPGVATRDSVIELLALDSLNPRSVLNQLERVKDHVAYLPGADDNHLSPLQRRALSLHASLAVDAPQAVSEDRLREILSGISKLSAEIAQTHLQ